MCLWCMLICGPYVYCVVYVYLVVFVYFMVYVWDLRCMIVCVHCVMCMHIVCVYIHECMHVCIVCGGIRTVVHVRVRMYVLL